ncbi:hypothetical protein [Streptomyces sp. NPDC057199]|uniref:hypothetical protein n=1 Tax=Streptomyces sp. NPDC057199 TaxID=3346047 RepID=UPI003636887C
MGVDEPGTPDAEVGETRVVDVQPGEVRVVDVQLGESRVADARRAGDAVSREGAGAGVGLGAGAGAGAGLGAGVAPASGRKPTAHASQAASAVRGASGHGSESAGSDRDASAYAGEGAAADRKPSARRGAVDPVKALMHRHRELCERAVDPLEIAAGLEAHGVTDRTATRFRHRDVFSLAEEMYARVPRAGDTAPRSEAPDSPKVRADWALLTLLPGALCAATVTGLRLTEGRPRLAVAVVGVFAISLGLRAAVRRGPLRAARAWHPTTSTRAWTCGLLAYALLGDGLLAAGIEGGPDGPPTGGSGSPWPIALASVLALTLAVVPAAWCAHLFAVRARRRLATSRGLEEFASSVRPLLLGVFGLFLCALGGLLAGSGAWLGEPPAYAAAGALGALLLLARLLTVHGFTHAPAVILAAAGTAQALALVSVFAGRLPGGSLLARPVETAAAVWGPGSVPALVCGGAALVLLIHATRTLTRASAHAAHGDTP